MLVQLKLKICCGCKTHYSFCKTQKQILQNIQIHGILSHGILCKGKLPVSFILLWRSVYVTGKSDICWKIAANIIYSSKLNLGPTSIKSYFIYLGLCVKVETAYICNLNFYLGFFLTQGYA